VGSLVFKRTFYGPVIRHFLDDCDYLLVGLVQVNGKILPEVFVLAGVAGTR
jgi:hypothetical protein